MYLYCKGFTLYTFIFKLDYICVLFRSRFERIRKFIRKWGLTKNPLIIKTLSSIINSKIGPIAQLVRVADS